MFNLDQAIADWRRQMLAAGIKTPVPLEELESHLREDVEQQMQSGLRAQQAFENSVQRIGHADELKSEFKKICGMKFYLRWMLLWIGGNGLIVTVILNLVGLYMFPGRVPVFFSHGWWHAWFPCYTTWIIFSIIGFVVGLNHWTKWSALWIGGIGLIGTIILNLVGQFVFHRSLSVFFSDDWGNVWFPIYLAEMGFTFAGLVAGLSIGFGNRKLSKATRD
jgi:hypothetical protein